ncbi:hypothetical protein APA_4681 [Pseudanabaena sp. lw0831]|nr:hypothetical protein APA_4681 [Pseudanabaena sp. lw0831]
MQMMAHSFTKQKAITVRVWNFHFTNGKMETAIEHCSY